MQSKVATITNGVDVNRLTETIDAVKATPELGKFQFRVGNRWIDGGENHSQVQSFSAGGQEVPHKTDFTLVADEADMLLGTDKGANPVEYLLHALAACVTTSMVYHAAGRGIAIEHVESTVEGDLDLRGFLNISPNIRNGYQNIRVKLRIKADVTDKQLQELGALGPMFSPVYETIARGVRVAVSAERMS
jgi:uncharacterized OsmC-like protein